MAQKGKLADGADAQTVWLKFNEREYKGKKITTFKGSVDIGGGKMLSISLYADLTTIKGDDGKELIGAYVQKWKSDKPARAARKSW